VITVVVEGPSDAGFIEEVCRRVGVECRVLITRGNRVDKVARLIKAVAPYTEQVLVLKDAHRLTERVLRGLEERLIGKLGDLKDVIAKVKVLRVVESIESWILAGFCEENPEGTPNPEARLRERVGGFLVKSWESYRRIAVKIDIEHAERRSPSFREFLGILKSQSG